MSGDLNGLIIAIDGHSSTGKSSYAKRLAAALNYVYVDTGAMYRAVTLHCMEKGLFKHTDEPAAHLIVKELPAIDISFRRNQVSGANETCLGDRVVEKEIRSMEISAHVSYISTIPEVREKLVALQREIGASGGVVMDGRDIGTVVYPDAEIKLFMTAKPEIRAERRRLELEEKGTADTFENVLANIKKRDHIDSTRAHSPLKRADDALLLDNSEMTIDGQVEWFFQTFRKELDGSKS